MKKSLVNWERLGLNQPTALTALMYKNYKESKNLGVQNHNSTGTYSGKVWYTGAKYMYKIQSTEIDYWRKCCRLTRQYRVRNKEVWNIMGIFMRKWDSKLYRYPKNVNRKMA